MKRKNIFLFIAIVAVLALVSCSGKKETSGVSSEILAQAEKSTNSGGYDNLTIPPASHTALTDSQWVNGNLTAANLQWYSFSVTQNTKYYVWWNDRARGDGSKTADIEVSAYYSNGDIVYCELYGTEPILNEDQGWETTREITAVITGTIYLAVRPFDNDVEEIGTYSIVYSTNKNLRNNM